MLRICIGDLTVMPNQLRQSVNRALDFFFRCSELGGVAEIMVWNMNINPHPSLFSSFVDVLI